MKLYFYGLRMIIKKVIFRQNTGDVVKWFATHMGVVYIKLAQMLAMQNFGNLFTEEDRVKLSSICDNCNPIPYKKIEKIIEKEYGCSVKKKFRKIYQEPIGSASISQVHKAVLKNGKVVAIKVKRKDVTKHIHKDIKQIRKFIHRFGKFVKFKNYLGSDVALNLYLDWILEETDFEHEKENILRYYQFTKTVNGKIENSKRIVVPRVYKNLCTENIIVMQFIFSKTINQLDFTKENKVRIKESLNDYVCLSFYALLHQMPVVFHGDPHGGNIYIDKYGNVGFLDMGLIFELTSEECELTRKLFLNAYFCNMEELCQLLIDNSPQKNVDREKLKYEMKKCCKQFSKIPVTKFFMDMINVYTAYNIDPPEFLYKMAKAMIAIFGMNTIIHNSLSTEELLGGQIIEFYVNRTVSDIKEVVSLSSKVIPAFLKEVLENGLEKSIQKEAIELLKINKKIGNMSKNWQEILGFFQE